MQTKESSLVETTKKTRAKALCFHHHQQYIKTDLHLRFSRIPPLVPTLWVVPFKCTFYFCLLRFPRHINEKKLVWAKETKITSLMFNKDSDWWCKFAWDVRAHCFNACLPTDTPKLTFGRSRPVVGLGSLTSQSLPLYWTRPTLIVWQRVRIIILSTENERLWTQRSKLRMDYEKRERDRFFLYERFPRFSDWFLLSIHVH